MRTSTPLVRALLTAVAVLTIYASPAAAAKVPLPTGVTITYAPCPDQPDAGGCAYTDPVAITAGAYGDTCRNPAGCIYLATQDRFARYHELGHVFDRQVLNDSARAWFARKLGRRHTGELFADAYANCALGNGLPGRRRNRWETAYGYSLQPRRHARICLAIEALGLLHDNP